MGAEIHEEAVGRAVGRRQVRRAPILSSVRLRFSRVFFWSYERGSWQYDVICLVILAFIFLTPRGLFHDRPTLGLTDLRHTQGVVEVWHTGDTSQYLVDARLVDATATANTTQAIEQILQPRLKKRFTIRSFQPVLDKNHVVLGYTVVISR